jgi:hypothetical protein
MSAHRAGQGDALFPWLATSATVEQMRWFLLQEVAGEAGFEDLLAMTQVHRFCRGLHSWHVSGGLQLYDVFPGFLRVCVARRTERHRRDGHLPDAGADRDGLEREQMNCPTLSRYQLRRRFRALEPGGSFSTVSRSTCRDGVG